MSLPNIILALTVLLCGSAALLAVIGLIYGLMIAADTRDVPDGNEDWL